VPGRPGGKRAENRRLRTEALERSALSLFLQHGVEAVTIDQIVDGARTAKGSFYRYFTDKTDIVRSLVEPVSHQVRESFARCASSLEEPAARGDVAKPYEALAQDLVKIVLSHPDVVRLYLHESRGPKSGARAPIVELAELVLDGATTLSKIAREQGLVRGLSGRLSAIAVVGASELMVARLFAGDDVGPVLEMPAELVSLVLDGVRARPGLPLVSATERRARPPAPDTKPARRAPTSPATASSRARKPGKARS
jgi:AcrR family transcriptional regulator